MWAYQLYKQCLLETESNESVIYKRIVKTFFYFRYFICCTVILPILKFSGVKGLMDEFYGYKS